MNIRTITPADYPAVDQLIRDAFINSENGYNQESELVASIRKLPNYDESLEVVALQNHAIVGHGLLSSVNIVTDTQTIPGLVLAPIDVTPTAQRQGIGTQIMAELEERARQHHARYISILGQPDYYHRFDYVPASQYNIYPPYSVPDDFFMIKPLAPGALDNISGTIQYSDAFSD